MLDLIRLRVLVAVAQEGSVTAAADSLGYAQPSISHHLRQLESEVGVPLFQRAGRGLRLTDAGTVLVQRATEILGHVDAAVAEVQTYAGLRAGRLRLAAFPSALASVIPQAMATFTSRHPEVSISLVETEPPKALALLRNNDVDVAVVFAHEDTADIGLKNVTQTTLLEDPLYLITSARNVDAANEITDYAGETWIAGCPSCRAHLLTACGRAGFVPRIEFETDDYVAVQALVASGSGVSTLPSLALLAHRNPDIRAHRIPDERRTISVATYGRPPRAPAIDAFVQTLTAVSKSMRERVELDGHP
ncbi:LysR family transcriptional regulator [Rhodococcus sp. (in: high G+C Gram-positive bacteria)]|uniref:LysR family transcriptional regulator n=1 Tax=Rhodococcus sp. TaxID=1831 RepID=UPI001A2C539F|nr:LysR family transcriptional regulator [Rhodococcus sp. (in: high G+C Gram-positive bacteria)]MBJ7477236.1 LysR family transcriptional regulator [Rhodococcus sp. (in: high G+C Gram-positive bacteria)]